MRALRHLAAIVVVVTAAGYSSDSALSPASAARTGTIRGQVVNATTGDPQPGVRVALAGGRAGGTPIVRRARTSANGRYEFSNLRTGSDFFYAIDARFDGGLFPGRALTLPSDTAARPVIETTLRVWPTTTDATAILFRRNDMFVVPAEQGLAVIESVRVLNTSSKAYVGRSADGPTGVTLGFALPRAAERRGLSIVDSTLDVPELVPTDFGFGMTVAIPPGETRISFAYTVNGSAGSTELSRPALYPILEASIYAADGVRIESNRLSAGKEVTLEGKTYRAFSTEEALDAGDPLQAVGITEVDGEQALAVGAIGALSLVALIGAVAFVLARRSSKREPEPPVEPEGRKDLIAAIAELDLLHETGELGTDEWLAKRLNLRAELDRLATGPTA